MKKFVITAFVLWATVQKLCTESAYTIAQALDVTPVVLHTLQHADDVTSAVFSPDGSKVVTASDDNTAKIWNSVAGVPLYTLQHAGPVRSAVFSPDGSRVVTASQNTAAKIWGSHALLIKNYFSNKKLPLAQQALLVTLNTLSGKKSGGLITKRDLVDDIKLNWGQFLNINTSILFTGIPPEVIQALKIIYNLDDDIF